MDSVGLYGYLHSSLTHLNMHLYAVNHQGTVLQIMRLWESWCKGWMKMVWWKSMMDHGKHWWFYLKNHIKKMCHGIIISGGCVCPTKNWTSSPTHLPSPYLAVMTQYRTLTQKQSILLLCIWTVVMASSGIIGGAQKTGILHPVQKYVVESDANGGPKCSPNICRNEGEAKKWMVNTS